MTDFGDLAPVPKVLATDSQTGRILAWMQDGNRINQLEATRLFGCTRLAPRIFELREAGHKIESRLIRAGRTHVSIYWINQAPPPAAPATTGKLFT